MAGGDVELTEEGQAQGASDFGTARVVGVALRKKSWYFEVRCVARIYVLHRDRIVQHTRFHCFGEHACGKPPFPSSKPLLLLELPSSCSSTLRSLSLCFARAPLL